MAKRTVRGGQFSVYNAARIPLLSPAMSQPSTKLATPASIAVDAVLVLAFFAFLYTVVSPHVPSRNPNMVRLWGALTAACMSGVFWLCIQMFRVVLRAQLERRKS